MTTWDGPCASYALKHCFELVELSVVRLLWRWRKLKGESPIKRKRLWLWIICLFVAFNREGHLQNYGSVIGFNKVSGGYYLPTKNSFEIFYINIKNFIILCHHRLFFGFNKRKRIDNLIYPKRFGVRLIKRR